MLWNIRGLGTSKKRLKKSKNRFKPCVLGIAEPFHSLDQLVYLKNYLNFIDGITNEEFGGKL